MLVYEYVNNGNLEQWLHGAMCQYRYLTWEARMKVLLGTACLFTPSHRDIKSSNILIDDNFNAKKSDFGLTKYPADWTSLYIMNHFRGFVSLAVVKVPPCHEGKHWESNGLSLRDFDQERENVVGVAINGGGGWGWRWRERERLQRLEEEDEAPILKSDSHTRFIIPFLEKLTISIEALWTYCLNRFLITHRYLDFMQLMINKNGTEMIWCHHIVPKFNDHKLGFNHFVFQDEGGYHRYIAEFKVGDGRNDIAKDTMNSYTAALVAKDPKDIALNDSIPEKGILDELKTDLARAKKGKSLFKGADGKPKKNLNPEA
ncbi:hypothetical protein RHGRI_017029 [Rhododendron griersonianum]|uniref:non-specific serine/threonine protein kinase n=1 Tax=Rhododendron griersonianum TaxID=479676 RepID=A0AAV6JWD0_9ERIC|nr:hypothetical protein RHGRI_017029 [Rhododendron griersonianum]